ncbi:GumC domain-containing protein [Tautonia plasticadhaerens]|uniref:Uncharacterized protein n=1 Tax=Tautonia plasticadhaerens TaxID=2527974 RepID=A0A518H158_9BACT|nr:hypothetical protein [Tautonia plasticadhaerens]QDV34553.1 hypothetical protein ElP_24430 [Tautonia plasticadhaerens]
MRRTVRIRWISAFFLVGLLIVAALVAVLRPEDGKGLMARTLGGDDRTSSLLRIETDPANPFSVGRPDREEVDALLQTQVQLITSPSVLTVAASDREVSSLEFVKRSGDAVEAIRDHLEVRILEGSSLVEVASRGLPPDEGAIVVNAVVDAFLREDATWADARNRNSIMRLEAYREELETKVEALSQSLDDARRTSVAPDRPPVDRAIIEADLLDCLGQLRRVRLDRAALQAGPDGPGVAEGSSTEIEAFKRQEALLISERDRMASLLAESDEALAAESRRRPELEHHLELKRRVDDRIERLEYESRGSAPILIISRASP